jgi:osmoprotectant transport system substrate-binding protein
VRAPKLQRRVAAGIGIAVAGLVVGCGSESSAPESEESGKGRPPVTIGWRDTPEQRVLGELFAQALREKGFSVRVKPDFDDAKAIDAAARNGQIDVYPEYVGVIIQVVGASRLRPKSPREAYNAAKRFEERRGLTLLNASPYSKNTTLAARTTYLTSRGIPGLRRLAKVVGSDFTLGGPPELRTRFDGLVGLKSHYGLSPTFVPMGAGEVYRALDAGRIDVGAVTSTDPQLLNPRYRTLMDPRKIFGFQNVAPVVSQRALRRSGPAFAAALDDLTRRLGPRPMRRLNRQVQLRRGRAADVAREFLAATKKRRGRRTQDAD